MITIADVALVVLSLIAVTVSLAYNWRLFLKKYAISVPVIAVIFFVYHSFLVFPVFVLSLISASMLYSLQFYLPFAVDFGLIMYFLVVHGKTYSATPIDVTISIATILVMLEDKRIRDFSHNNDQSRGISKEREINRDYVQIGIGIIVLIFVLSLGLHDSAWILTVAVLALYLLGNYFSNNGSNYFGNFLNSLERESTPLGIGAIWLAAGLLLAIGIVGNLQVLAIIIFILMVGDSLATIIGSSVRSPKLPYNRRKSVAGLLADFIPAAIFAFVLLGYTGIVFAAVGSVVESAARYPLDDNYMIPLVLAATSFFL
ncbi:MAG: diacylglycerol/polyprenol kinase family protein [Thermoplasmataceae archaeon]